MVNKNFGNRLPQLKHRRSNSGPPTEQEIMDALELDLI